MAGSPPPPPLTLTLADRRRSPGDSRCDFLSVCASVGAARNGVWCPQVSRNDMRRCRKRHVLANMSDPIGSDNDRLSRRQRSSVSLCRPAAAKGLADAKRTPPDRCLTHGGDGAAGPPMKNGSVDSVRRQRQRRVAVSRLESGQR